MTATISPGCAQAKPSTSCCTWGWPSWASPPSPWASSGRFEGDEARWLWAWPPPRSSLLPARGVRGGPGGGGERRMGGGEGSGGGEWGRGVTAVILLELGSLLGPEWTHLLQLVADPRRRGSADDSVKCLLPCRSRGRQVVSPHLASASPSPAGHRRVGRPEGVDAGWREGRGGTLTISSSPAVAENQKAPPRSLKRPGAGPPAP